MKGESWGHNNQMEILLAKLEALENGKEELKKWCKSNGVKVSFLVAMAPSRAKSINKKLNSTYSKGFGKVKTRWLENELKLFHFALLLVSCLSQTPIYRFNQANWQTLQEAFPNKDLNTLKYEAASFVSNRAHLGKKWSTPEDSLLRKIIEIEPVDPKWNQVATDLFIKSEGTFFRNSKQCRQRWLNHLNDDVNHDKWTPQEDLILVQSVLQHGKKWSLIMKCFENRRTEHMIKNRFLSLTLKCKKSNPMITDEESALKKISEEFGLKPTSGFLFMEDLGIEKRLRPKERPEYEREESSESQIFNEEEEIKQPEQGNQQKGSQKEEIRAECRNPLERETIIVAGSNADQNLFHLSSVVKQESMGCENNFPLLNDFMQKGSSNIPTPSTFMSPISPFVDCNSFMNSFNYFQWCMSNFSGQNNFGQ